MIRTIFEEILNVVWFLLVIGGYPLLCHLIARWGKKWFLNYPTVLITAIIAMPVAFLWVFLRMYRMKKQSGIWWEVAKYSGANFPKSIWFLGYVSGIVLAQQYWDAPFVLALVIAIPCSPFTMIPFYLIDWLILDRLRKEADRHYS